MFSDTHFHFHYLVEKNSPKFGAELLSEMGDTDVYFGMDIGTDCEDLLYRCRVVEDCLELMDEEHRKKAEKFMYFSAGIWPDVESIVNREECIKKLENQIESFKNGKGIFSGRLAAIGEGGLDHHWNPSGTDGRCKDDFNDAVYNGETELFEMQLHLAKKMQLPFIVHSRDAYEDTLQCIKNSGYNRGIIHCYSYGLEEAKSFLDLGWYISLSGSVTYTKKSKMEDMKKLLAYIPEDRILLETDSPYLAPVPVRGNPNNPVFVRHTYEFVAGCRNVSTEELCFVTDKNISALFNIPPAGL